MEGYRKSTILEKSKDVYKLAHIFGGQSLLCDIQASIKEESDIGYQVRRRRNENKQASV